ncbi:MAG TPA: Hsp20 family protein [Bauldia sp.]|nr:Hsp20 family protein [Bauldia sp.]
MTRFPAFSGSLRLGFDEVGQAADRLSRPSGDGYPPYNIERVTGAEGEILRIILAVAGFAEDELVVTVEENELVIRGRRKEDETPRMFFHRGIAARQFQRSFVLSRGIEVLSAKLEAGLLSIDLAKPQEESAARKIAINRRGP